ncbi:MAG: SPOR domain-containing protein [Deltaproteobacteria bacterium]|nr:SPOR domain-containing protein [Deltaproteobacteria bacterium]
MGKAKEKSRSGQKMIVISRSYAFLLGCFILFLFFWMFVLGVLVGKGVIPGAMFDIKHPINRVRALFGLNEKIEYEPPKEASLDFYADLENKKKKAKVKNLITAEDKIPDQQITLSRDEKSPLPDTGNEVRVVIRSKETGEEATPLIKDDTIQTPLADEKKEKSLSSSSKELPPDRERVAGEHYSVQIAAISDLTKAKETIKDLVDRGYDAYYYAATVNGKKTFRIMCGRFHDRNDAVKYHLRLKNELGYNGFISKVEAK